MKKLLVIILLFLLVAGCKVKTQPQSFQWTKPYPLWYEQLINTSLPDCPNKLDRGYLPKRIFCELPNKPERFDEMVLAYSSGHISDLQDIPENFWVQPEFVEGTSQIWSKSELPALQNPPTGAIYETISALSVYPSEFPISIEVSPEEKNPYYEFDIMTSIRSTGLQTFWLGIEPDTVFPKNLTLSNGNMLSDGTSSIANPSDVRDYVEVNYTGLFVNSTSGWDATNSKIYTTYFLVAPSARMVKDNQNHIWIFPYYNKDYVKLLKIHIKIKVLENGKVKTGRYAFGVAFGNPSEEFNERMIKFTTGLKYKPAGLYEPYQGFERVKVFVEVTKAVA